jgi:aryl-alcohol dehydrogenase-like predicted oxidoreductase
MEYGQLGRSGTRVSRICLGTMNVGPLVSRDECWRMLDAALDAGVNFVDTANNYGGPERGLVERWIGEWFAAEPSRRGRVVLATKVYFSDDAVQGPGLSARTIRLACEASLRRLRTDYIDLYQLHHVDLRTPLVEVWEALASLIAHGRVIYAGTSNFAAWQLVQAGEAARRAGGLGFVTEQSKYSLLTRAVELEVGPACEALGVGLLAYSPLAQGLLAAADGPGATARRRVRPVREQAAERRDQLDAFAALCQELGQTPQAVALAWLRTRSFVCAPVVGPRSTEQLLDLVGSVELTLDDATLGELDRIFPGPGRAPEAYAW